MFELYHSVLSPCAQKVRLVLAEKGIDYTSRLVDVVAKENLRADYLKLNPNGVVPTLVHDGEAVIESTLIAEYLEDVRPSPPLRPADALGRARMRLWTKLVDESLHPATGALVWSTVMRRQYQQKGRDAALTLIGRVPSRPRRERQLRIFEHGWEAPDAVAAVRSFRSAFGKMDAALLHGEWLLGAAPTLADLALAPYVQSVHQLGLDDILIGEHDRLRGWFERVRRRGSFATEVTAKLPAERLKMYAGYGEEARPIVRRLVREASA